VTGAKTQIPRFIYAGQGGTLSVEPLRCLLEAGIRPLAVLMPHKPVYAGHHKLNLLPVQPPRLLSNLANMAIENDLPLITWERGRENELAQVLAEYAPECVIVSCFPWRVTMALLTIPRHGWWNLHPSLLPAYRGPSPLFWQARDEVLRTGITLHCMTGDFDEGAILNQSGLDTDQMTLRELERQLGQMGGRLIVKALNGLLTNQLIQHEQNAQQASYQPMPTLADRRISLTGRASDAHTFISKVYDSYPLWLELDGQRFAITRPVAADDNMQLDVDWQIADDELMIKFEKGVLSVRAEELYGHS